LQIKPQKSAESLAAVIISVFILSIALLWIMNIVSFSKDTAIDYETEMFKHIIKSNSESLIRAFDYDNLENDETFYIYKDEVNQQYRIMTGSTNSGSKYIDNLWNRIDNLSESLWKTYKREFVHKSDILKHRIDPPEIPNLVFHFDAQNPYGDNTTPSDWTNISTWTDLSNWYHAVQVTWKSRTITSWLSTPTINNTAINWHPWLSFNGTNDIYQLPLNIDISNDDNWSYDKVYNQKSFSLVFKTSDNINSEQVIYEQGWVWTWYNFIIYDGDLYAWIHNTATNFSIWDSGHKFKSVNLWEILPNTVYYVTVVQDSNNFDINWDPVDRLNRLQIFLNGELASEAEHVNPQWEHHIAWIWGVNEWNVKPWDEEIIRASNWYCDNQCLFFEWYIWEFASWNHALTKAEVRGIHNYLLEKWLHWKQSVNYSIIDTNISKYNSN